MDFPVFGDFGEWPWAALYIPYWPFVGLLAFCNSRSTTRGGQYVKRCDAFLERLYAHDERELTMDAACIPRSWDLSCMVGGALRADALNYKSETD